MSTTKKPRAPRRLAMSDLTKVEQRIVIARDVVKQVKAGRYRATEGVYSYLSSYCAWDQVQDEADQMRAGETRCPVCAIGAAIVSAIGLFNGTAAENFLKTNNEHTAVRKYFTAKQAREMEAAFEHYDCWSGPAALWGRQWEDPADRLEAIYTNIAENEGQFDLKWTPSPRSRLGKAMVQAEV